MIRMVYRGKDLPFQVFGLLFLQRKTTQDLEVKGWLSNVKTQVLAWEEGNTEEISRHVGGI